ncbi:YciI family protein [Paenibacillus hamazuiensis]|uniref:YciI family protein n=1 Tax=Paenibacillus hamazuiensis TaxID=2936508 RepID=UPI00200E7401|nr:YciI family protein [Paenibacillus hamazuiensis]
MKYYAVFLKMIDPQKSQESRPAHLEYLAKRKGEGKIFAYGRFADGAGGLVIYIAESEAEVRQLAAEDPYIVNGAREAEIHEWEMMTDAVLPGVSLD